MPKYRLLTHEELMEFEKEFIEYLIVNGITAEDWTKIKTEQANEAVKIIGLFSDVVFEGTMRKLQFIEARTSKEVRCFQCLEEKIILVGMRVPKESEMDFTDTEMLENALSNPPEGIEIYTAEKAYNDERNLELFDMLQKGCTIADGKLYKALSLALAESKS